MMGGMQPSVGSQHWPFSQVSVGGQMAPSGPQPVGGGKQKFCRQHMPSMQSTPIGHAAPVPQPIMLVGTQVPFWQIDPSGQGASGPHDCARQIPLAQALPGGQLSQPPTGTHTPS